MNVIIKSAELTNFRNIEHAIYNLDDTCVIEGKNHIGKTNILLAIYWTLTDKMMDGRSDSPSVKPLQDTSKKASVKLNVLCDDVPHTIEKIYYENWTKKRGSGILTLTSHITEYVIDEIKQKTVGDALSEIRKIIGISSSQYFNLKVEMEQALMNPYYLSEILDWKTLRELIVKIIGDVNNDEVYTKEPTTLNAKEYLEKYNYDFSKTLTFLNQKISESATSLVAKETLINDLEKCEDVAEEDVIKAQEKIADINKQIENLNAGNIMENPQIATLNEEITKDRDLLKAEENKLTEAYNKALSEYTSKYESLSDKLYQKQDEIKKLGISNLEYKLQSLEFQKSSEEMKITNLSNNRAKLVDEYKKIQARTFTAVEHKCPNCGYVENADEIEQQKTIFENTKASDLQENISKGKSIKLDLENAKNKINEYDAQIITLKSQITELKAKEELLNADLSSIQKEFDDVKLAKPIKQYTNDIINDLKDRINNNTQLVNQLKSAPLLDMQSQRIALKQSQKPYDDILTKHYGYLDNMRKKEQYEADLTNIAQQKIAYETAKESLNLFSRTKLELLNDKLAAAFGEVKFVLIQSNIAEGSWQQVCYPLIIGTKTPFVNGSPSEKITTGIKIIEAFKKLLNLSDLPILVDEIGQLDDNSILNIKDYTQSQIISTRVNNDYDIPTVHII